MGQPGIRAGDTRVSHTSAKGECGTTRLQVIGLQVIGFTRLFMVVPYLNLVFLLLYIYYAKNNT